MDSSPLGSVMRDTSELVLSLERAVERKMEEGKSMLLSLSATMPHEPAGIWYSSISSAELE